MSDAVLAPIVGDPPQRLAAAAEEVTRVWLLRVLERISVDEPQRLPDHALIPEATKLVRALAMALEGGSSPSPELRDSVASIARLRGEAGHDASDVVLELADLELAIAEELRRAAEGDWGADRLALARDRLTVLFAHLQAGVVEEYLRGRSGRLEMLATTDPLTGLYNVRFMRERLDYLVQIRDRYGHPFSLLLIDVNGLKQINDSLGHAAGDEALNALASLLRSQLRDVDVPVRLGGDEFCVLLPETDDRGARLTARRIAAAVDDHPLESGATLRISLGVAASPAHSDDPDRLLEIADGAMYEAKHAGRAVGVPLSL